MKERRIMKAGNVAMVFLMALFVVSTALYAKPEPEDKRPYIGVLLDESPLPDLLVKHLRLSPDQGIRIENVHRGGPADEAGLERDDIIIGLQGEDVTDLEEFIEDVRALDVGTEISLEIIHLGERKPAKLKLDVFEGEFDWKYPRQPEIVQSWRPGKMFRLKPGSETWMEIPFRDIPAKLEFYLKGLSQERLPGLLREAYVYHYSDGDETYDITIEGNPSDENTEISVRVGKKEYGTSIKEMDELPKKYRAVAEEALEHARKSSKQSKAEQRLHMRFYEPSVPTPPFDSGDEMFDRIEKQMRKLQERLEALEKRHGEMFDRFLEESDKEESEKQEEPVRQEDKDSQKV
jgi:hypothetical protein